MKTIGLIKEGSNGTLYHYDAYSLLHNDHGPAIITLDNTEYYYKQGLLHNEEGPAVVNPNGDHKYYLNGTEVTEDEFAVAKRKNSVSLEDNLKVEIVARVRSIRMQLETLSAMLEKWR